MLSPKTGNTCTRDGGSPLICPSSEHPESYYQAGVVSWTVKCGQNGSPGASVNVALFRDWIDEQVKAKGYDTSSYEP